MFEVLRDPMLQFVLGILAIVVTAIGILLTVRSQMRKSLSFRIVSCTPLLSVKREIREKLQILYEGKPIKQAYLCVVRFTSSGNVSILQADYIKNLTLDFGEKAQILTSEVVEQNPPNLGVSITIDGKNVVMSPSMLNRTDSFAVKSVVTDYEDVTVDGRIVGVKEIKRVGESKYESFWYPVLMVVTMILYFSGMAGYAWIGTNSASIYQPFFAGLIVTSGVLLIALAAWSVITTVIRLLERRRKSS